MSRRRRNICKGIEFRRRYRIMASVDKKICIEPTKENAGLIEAIKKAVEEGESEYRDGLTIYRIFRVTDNAGEKHVVMELFILTASFRASEDSVKKWLALWQGSKNAENQNQNK